MEPIDQLGKAIDAAAVKAVPDDGREFITGDYLGLAEVLFDDGRMGIVILAPQLTSSHARLLSTALHQAVGALLASSDVVILEGGESDAA